MWFILIYFHRVDLEYYFIHFAEKQVWMQFISHIKVLIYDYYFMIFGIDFRLYS